MKGETEDEIGERGNAEIVEGIFKVPLLINTEQLEKWRRRSNGMEEDSTELQIEMVEWKGEMWKGEARE